MSRDLLEAQGVRRRRRRRRRLGRGAGRDLRRAQRSAPACRSTSSRARRAPAPRPRQPSSRRARGTDRAGRARRWRARRVAARVGAITASSSFALELAAAALVGLSAPSAPSSCSDCSWRNCWRSLAMSAFMGGPGEAGRARPVPRGARTSGDDAPEAGSEVVAPAEVVEEAVGGLVAVRPAALAVLAAQLRFDRHLLEHAVGDAQARRSSASMLHAGGVGLPVEAAARARAAAAR